MIRLFRFLMCAVCLAAVSVCHAGGWPVYRHDNQRSGRTLEQLDAAKLRQQWVWRSPQPPRPAWAGPAMYDAYHGIGNLRSMRDYDPVFHVVAAGGSVYFGSSVDDSVRCLDAATGKVRWRYTTGAPVRVAPAVAGGNVYFGSDDGHAYCLRAKDGELVWKLSPGPSGRMVLNDGRMISLRPCRTGVLVDNGTAYFATSMLPWEHSYLCAVDAETGKPNGNGRYVRIYETLTLEGAFTATADRLFMPQGRVAPMTFDRASGKDQGEFGGGGGSFVGLTDNGHVLQGHGNKSGWIMEFDAGSRRRVATYGRARDVVVSGGVAYVLTHRDLLCVDRKTRKARWSKRIGQTRAVILAGDTLFAGGDGSIAAFAAKDGSQLWTAPVAGKAFGLAVAGGSLFVSTDEGRIYCFRPGGDGAPPVKDTGGKFAPARPVDRKPIRLAMGPYLQFTGTDTAVVRWETAEPSPTVIEYGIGQRFRKIEDAKRKTQHAATLTGLERNRTYAYVIRALAGDKMRSTQAFACDTFFNYSLPDAPNGAPAKANGPDAAAAQRILAASGVTNGIGLVFGCGDGRLAYELAKQSRLRIIAVDTDAERVAAARNLLIAAGVYGSRVAVHHVDSLNELPFVGDFANLVVSASAAVEAVRVLRPAGGVLCIGTPRQASERKVSKEDLRNLLRKTNVGPKLTGLASGRWTLFVKLPLDGAGEWSHQYGLADNAAYGGETLRGARTTYELGVQWVGRPGPRYQPDRSGRKPAPLAVNGRLFGQGRNRIVAIDAYNGTILWSLEIPLFARFNIPRDTGNWCADGEHVFAVVKNKCWQIDAATGRVVRAHDVARGRRKEWAYEWGYVGREGKYLVGSANKAGAAYLGFWGKGGWYDGVTSRKVCSDNLFAIEKSSGTLAWTYTGGIIINPTITLAGGHAYFIESRSAGALASGSSHGRQVWTDQFMVKLDIKTGKTVWAKPFASPGKAIVFFLAHSDGKLVLVSNAGWSYRVYGFDASNGRQLWHVSFSGRGDHGAHMSRPAIVDGTVFVRPKAIDLSTGKFRDYAMPGGGCGTYSMSKHAAFFRAVHTTMWSFDAARTSNWLRLRPGCWLSTVPANGMVLSPEASGGCTCGRWLETSIAFMPKVDVPVFETAELQFTGSLAVKIRAPLGGGQVHYTLDGSRPTASSPRYTGPVKLTKTALVRACGVRAGVAGVSVSHRYERITAKIATSCTVNFQPPGAPPKGCLADWGEPFGVRPNGYAYGWSRPMQRATRRRRRHGDPRMDSQIFFMPGIVWTIAVEDGTYDVTVCIGDGAYATADGTIYVNDVEFCKGVRLGAGHFKRYTKKIVVRNGKLVLRSHQKAAPAERTRVNYIELKKR